MPAQEFHVLRDDQSGVPDGVWFGLPVAAGETLSVTSWTPISREEARRFPEPPRPPGPRSHCRPIGEAVRSAPALFEACRVFATARSVSDPRRQLWFRLVFVEDWVRYLDSASRPDG